MVDNDGEYFDDPAVTAKYSDVNVTKKSKHDKRAV